MSITTTIERLLDIGYRPSEIVKMGYAKSTVYTVYKRWLKRKVGENALYVAYDTDYDTLEKFINQLRLLGYNVIAGGITRDTLDLISVSSLVVVIIGKSPGYRRQLLFKELEEAIKHDKQIIALIEEGSALPISLPKNSIAIYFSRDNIPKTIDNIVKILQTGRWDPLMPILVAIVMGLLIALGIAALMEILKLLLRPK